MELSTDTQITQPAQNAQSVSAPDSGVTLNKTSESRTALKNKLSPILEPFGLMECWVYGPYLTYYETLANGAEAQNPNRLDIGIRFGPGRNIFATELDIIRATISKQFNDVPVEILALTGMSYDQCSADELAVYMTGLCVIGPDRPSPSIEDTLKSIRTGAESILSMLDAGSDISMIRYTLRNAGISFERLARSCTILNVVFDTIGKK